MIVFTPKSMMRRKDAASQPEDFTTGTFRPVIEDEAVEDASAVRHAAALLGSDQLGPVRGAEASRGRGHHHGDRCASSSSTRGRSAEVKAELAKFPNLEEVRWVQDEPANMGPWPHMKLNLESELDLDGVAFTRVSRPESASPSVGQSSVHQQELQDLLTDAFA